MAYKRKRVFARVSLATGEYVASWYNISFSSFTKTLNGGLGECVFTVAFPFDHDSNDLAIGNDVEIVVVDANTTDGVGDFDNLSGKTVHKGYISLLERDINGPIETVTIHVLGYYTLLATDYLKNGAQTTLYSNTAAGLTATLGSQGAADIGLMMRAVIDRYRAETTNPKVYYIDKQFEIPNTGTTATYTFEQKTYREALDILKAMAPADTYWYINELGKLTFKAKPTSATHTFIFGKHFNKVNIQYSYESIRNFLLVWDGAGGGTYKHYQNDASIALYGRRAAAFNDYGVANSNAADALGAKFLAENKDPEIKIKCTIIDSSGDQVKGYDIESIQPGDTCKFVGFSSKLTDVFKDNMLITNVIYYLDRVELEIKITLTGLLDFTALQQRTLNAISTGALGIPTTYT